MKTLSYLNYKVYVVLALAMIQLKSADVASAQDRGRDPTGTSDPTAAEEVPAYVIEMQMKSGGLSNGSYVVGSSAARGSYSEQTYPSSSISFKSITDESSLSSEYVTSRNDAIAWDEEARNVSNDPDALEDIYARSYAISRTVTVYEYDSETESEYPVTTQLYTGYTKQTRFRVSIPTSDHPPIHFHALKITSTKSTSNDWFGYFDWPDSHFTDWPLLTPWYIYEDNETTELTLEPYEVSLPTGELTTEWIEFKAPLVDNQESFVALSMVHLRVDANRDGTIDDQDTTSLEKPFRFWVNNDQDDVEEDEPASVTTEDSADMQISTKRDLEDFCRLSINEIKPLSIKLRAGEYQIGLRFANIRSGAPAIRCWPNQSRDGDLSYLNETEAAASQISTTCFPVEGDTTMIPASYWEDSENPSSEMAGPVHILFEGVGRGEGELVVTIHDENGEKLVECGSLHLKLLDVREMYERAKVPNEAEEIPNPWVDDSPPAQTWVKDDWNWPPSEDPDAIEQTAIFVHGWRMPYMVYLNWADTSYKRLWHQGFRGKFYTFRWPTFSADNTPFRNNTLDHWQEQHTPAKPGGFTYNASEYRAWLSGPALANFVNQLPNAGNRSLFAHSMGNVITGAALRSGMLIDKYGLCNAAMASMAYDSGSHLKLDPNKGQPWNKIWDNIGPQKTPDTDPSATTRNAYGLQNKFYFAGDLQMINFYLREDDALESWINNNLIFKPDDNGHSYYYQETPVAPNISYKLFQAPLVGNAREVTSQPEAFGYVTKALTRTAGSDPRTGGSIGSSVNMDDWGVGANHSGFGNTHSAQWRWGYQSTNHFWKTLCEELALIER